MFQPQLLAIFEDLGSFINECSHICGLNLLAPWRWPSIMAKTCWSNN